MLRISDFSKHCSKNGAAKPPSAPASPVAGEEPKVQNGTVNREPAANEGLSRGPGDIGSL